MKIFLPLIVLALSACAVTSQRAPASADPGASPTPGVVTITSEQLKQTGRPDVSDALRMVSPIFH